MANSKISALTSATTPLAGTETLPVVQSGATKQVSVANLTAGRAVSASSLSLTTPLSTANGGTGLSSFTSGGVVYASSASALATNSLFNYNGNSALTLDNTGSVTFSIRAYDSGNDRNAGLQLLSSGNGGSVATITYGDTDTTPGTPSPLEFYGYHSGVSTKRFIMGTGGDFTLSTGNLVQGTAAKGINFTANTGATGMTSQLLNWYEEGIVNAILTDGTNNATMSSDSKMYYTRIGRMVYIQGYINTTSLGSVTGPVLIKGLPFTVNGAQSAARSALSVGQAGGLAITAGYAVTGFATAGATTIDLRLWNATTGASQLTAAQFTASGFISFSIAYPV
jgi:hypothetical protein